MKRLMISASNMPVPSDQHHHSAETTSEHIPTTILVLPSFTLIDQVTPSNVPSVIQDFISPGPSTTSSSTTSSSLPSPTSTLPHRTLPHDYLILLCSHRTRDSRCSISAPLLRREFERHLRPLGLHRDLHDDTRPGGVGIYFISHVGGHKYAANVIVYRKNQGQAIWLARIRPEDCEGVIKFTVLQGKVVRPERFLRGGFDRGRGLVSW